MSCPTVRILLAVLVIGLWLDFGGADFIFEIQVHSYTNPEYRRRNGSCCDPELETDPPPPVGQPCSDPCENRFIFCLQDSDDRSSNLGRQQCPYGRATEGDFEDSNDTLMFNDTVRGESWPVDKVQNDSVQLAVRVNEVDGDDTNITAIFFIDPLQAFVGTGFSNRIIHTPFVTAQMDYTGHRIELSYRVSCTENYFGSDCATFCVARDDSEGHYNCDSEGRFICIDNYSDPSSNCTVDLDLCGRISPCLNGATCNNTGPNQYECLCADGYEGQNCSIDLDPCGHTPPCLNGATCNNTGPDQFECLCAPGFTGRNCEQGSSSSSGSAVGGIVGGVIGGLLLLLVIVAILVVVIVLLHKRQHLNSYDVTTNGKPVGEHTDLRSGDNPVYDGELGFHDSKVATGSSTEHDFDNPLYDTSCEDGYTAPEVQKPMPVYSVIQKKPKTSDTTAGPVGTYDYADGPSIKEPPVYDSADDPTTKNALQGEYTYATNPAPQTPPEVGHPTHNPAPVNQHVYANTT